MNETISIPLDGDPSIRRLLEKTSRLLSENEWIDKQGSGTLRHSRDLGLAHRDLYLTERVSFTFGLNFGLVPRTRITWGKSISVGDCHAFTEALSLIRSYMSNHVFDVLTGPQYIQIESDCNEQGLGIMIHSTLECPWILKNNIVYAIVAPCKVINGRSDFTGEINVI